MLLTNTEEIPGKHITVCYGVVSGSTVRAKHAGRDIMAGLRNIFGGNVRSYETLVDRARREAVLRMKESCPKADQIINLRLETSSVVLH
ncbi:MAG: YbjQ family protein [Candidatus Electrothrix sp. GM3_4]|nr:YbjQ family protein [Candidatus Electrothrix sp. GM3_4]